MNAQEAGSSVNWLCVWQVTVNTIRLKSGLDPAGGGGADLLQAALINTTLQLYGLYSQTIALCLRHKKNRLFTKLSPKILTLVQNYQIGALLLKGICTVLVNISKSQKLNNVQSENKLWSLKKYFLFVTMLKDYFDKYVLCVYLDEVN